MAPALLLNQPIAAAEIRAEGERLGHEGDSLDEFFEIIAAVDQIDRSEVFQRQAKDIAEAQKKKK